MNPNYRNTDPPTSTLAGQETEANGSAQRHRAMCFEAVMQTPGLTAREIVQNIVYRDLLPMLNAVAETGAAIILLAHAANTKMTTPEGYDQRLASPDLPQWIAPPFIEWADCVLYAHRQDDHRVLLTEGTNVILAKNRYGLPAELPLSWPALMQAMTTNNTHSKEN